MKKLPQRPDLINQFISTFIQSLMKDMTRAKDTKKRPLCMYLSLAPYA